MNDKKNLKNIQTYQFVRIKTERRGKYYPHVHNVANGHDLPNLQHRKTYCAHFV